MFATATTPKPSRRFGEGALFVRRRARSSAGIERVPAHCNSYFQSAPSSYGQPAFTRLKRRLHKEKAESRAEATHLRPAIKRGIFRTGPSASACKGRLRLESTNSVPAVPKPIGSRTPRSTRTQVPVADRLSHLPKTHRHLSRTLLSAARESPPQTPKLGSNSSESCFVAHSEVTLRAARDDCHESHNVRVRSSRQSPRRQGVPHPRFVDMVPVD